MAQRRVPPAHLVVEVAQIVVHDGDVPDALADLRDAGILAWPLQPGSPLDAINMAEWIHENNR